MDTGFDLERALRGWRRTLVQQGLEPGHIEEIEGNVLDRMEDYMKDGLSQEEAFNRSCAKSLHNAEELASEFFKATSKYGKTPPWKRKIPAFSSLPFQVKIAWRHLIKRKYLTLMHVTGLSVSLSLLLLAWIYFDHETSFDEHFKNADRIYRLSVEYTIDGETDTYSNVPKPVAPFMKEALPGIEDAVRIKGVGQLETHTAAFWVGNKRITSSKVFAADPGFLAFFNYDLLSGNADQALLRPNTLVVSEALAIKLFGTSLALGKEVKILDREFEITGVFADTDDNTHLPVDALVSWNTYPNEGELDQWFGGHVYTYLLLDEENDVEAVKRKVPGFYDQYMKKTFDRIGGEAHFIFQPLTGIYLDPEYLWEPYPHGSQTTVYVLLVVVILLMLVTCINYINLATARSTERVKEIGIRKTMGSSRRHLSFQLFAETLLIAFFVGVITLLLAIILLPYFNQLSGINLGIYALLSLPNISFVFVLSIFVGSISSIYPTYQILSFKPIHALVRRSQHKTGKPVLRNTLIVVQYTVSLVLITAVLVVFQQTDFVKNKDVGYVKDNLLVIKIPKDEQVTRKLQSFKQVLSTKPYVLGVTSADYSLSDATDQWIPSFEDPKGTIVETKMDLVKVDKDFVSTIGLQVVEGNDFNKKVVNEKAILLNETAARENGWLGQATQVKFLYEDENENPVKYRVAGVVNDFNIGVSYHHVRPLMIVLDNNSSNHVYLGLAAQEIHRSTRDLENTWKQHFPGYEFDYEFLDQELASLYHREENFLRLLTLFSVVTIFITCLGIIGLVSYVSLMRKKEIAIRKLVGSSFLGIVVLLTKNFIKLQVLAACIGLPISYYLVQKWLGYFEIRIDLNGGPFAIALCLCMFFSLLTMMLHTTRAALERPVTALRSE